MRNIIVILIMFMTGCVSNNIIDTINEPMIEFRKYDGYGHIYFLIPIEENKVQLKYYKCLETTANMICSKMCDSTISMDIALCQINRCNVKRYPKRYFFTNYDFKTKISDAGKNYVLKLSPNFLDMSNNEKIKLLDSLSQLREVNEEKKK